MPPAYQSSITREWYCAKCHTIRYRRYSNVGSYVYVGVQECENTECIKWDEKRLKEFEVNDSNSA
jgi:hypothetical protein